MNLASNGKYSIVLEKAGDSGARTYNVRMYVRATDGAAPSTRIRYLNAKQAINLGSKEYITVDGLEVWGVLYNTIGLIATKTGFTVQNCAFKFSGSGTQGDGGETYGEKSSAWTASVALHGGTGANTINNIVIQDNTFSKTIDMAIRVVRGNGVSIKNNTITNCEYGQHSWPGLIYMTLVANAIIENNLLDTVADDGINTIGNEVHGIWFDAGAEGTNNNAVIRYNKVKNVSGIGIYYESAYASTIHYNVVDTASVGIRHGGTWECRNLSIYNNTVYGTTTMGLYPNDLTATYTSTLKNNIITPTSGYFIYVGSAMLGTLTVSNNLYDSNFGTDYSLNWYYGSAKNYDDCIDTSSETNSQFANPLCCFTLSLPLSFIG